jgi:N-methylhydantoinase A
VSSIIETTSGEAVDASVFVRTTLPKGARIAGPAVIVEDGTSTIVPTGHTAYINAGDDIVIEEIEA